MDCSFLVGVDSAVQICAGGRVGHLTVSPRSMKCVKEAGLSRPMTGESSDSASLSDSDSESTSTLVQVDSSSRSSDVALLEGVPETLETGDVYTTVSEGGSDSSLESTSGTSSDERPQHRRQARMSSGHPPSGSSQSAKEVSQKSLNASLETGNTSPRPPNAECKKEERVVGTLMFPGRSLRLSKAV